MRFPLEKQKVGGYDYGVKTSYSAHHLGVDWEANQAPLYAPCNGRVLETLTGVEGGNTIWFQPDGQLVIIRWMHLSKFLCSKGQHLVEGEICAVTGNTGEETTGPHLHEDIWKNKVTLKFEDTINPHTFYTLMGQFKTQEKNGELRIVLSASTIEEWNALCKVYGVSPATINEHVK